jgi:Peptidase propeptide and YPEB domain
MTMQLKASSLAVIAFLGSMILAAGTPCSIHPKTGAKKDELAAMAKITRDDAQTAALASFKDSTKATVKEAELEAEHGCLVYSFDIAIAGRSGIQEVQVDAGTGKVLSSKHESAKAEVAEKAEVKSKPPGN